MSYWRLTVEQFGKIEHAEIELAPLTLFVGDNNSGKSYLLSLAWAMKTIARDVVFSEDAVIGLKSTDYDEIERRLLHGIDQAEDGSEVYFEIAEILPELQSVINELLLANKQALVKAIYNSDSVLIGNVTLTMPDDIDGRIGITREGNKVSVSYQNTTVSFSNLWITEDEDELLDRKKLFSRLSVNWLITRLLDARRSSKRMIYLPAARTGFMLTKDVINKFARKKTYDIEIETEESAEIQPFSRPIIEFLDVINELSEEQRGNEKYHNLVNFIQNKMVQGKVEIASVAGKELSYIPQGQNMRYPFRTTSAVVTELSPLLLLLEHQDDLACLFYEEPEMCLHPALQKRMGQVLIRLVDCGINVITTTHSDIILQHINNMIRLTNSDSKPEDYGYLKEDLIEKESVRVYQLQNNVNGITEISTLTCGEMGFAVPTFNDALDEMMEETIQLQK